MTNHSIASIISQELSLKFLNSYLDFSETNSVTGGGKAININSVGANSIAFSNNTGEYGTQTLICGKLWAKDEVVVQTTDPWPDYVFAPEYKLMPLKELEMFIKKNNHLPNVASAGEIKKEGIKLAETNVVLLQKIEELTLYLVKQNKEINELKERINKLENN
jgi:hypothetical protein